MESVCYDVLNDGVNKLYLFEKDGVECALWDGEASSIMYGEYEAKEQAIIFTMSNKEEMLYSNNLEWYVVTYDNGSEELIHASRLSNILHCGEDKLESGITGIERCWNGDDLRD
jgi:hypothetical protein